MAWKHNCIGASILGAGLCLSASCANAEGAAETARNFAAGAVISQIYWSDGDSGRIDGVPFRLADIDAPETGGVGARGGAKCEVERELGFAAKEAIVEMSRPSEHRVVVTRVQDADRYGRVVVDLSVEGEDLGDLGVASGHMGAWPHRKGRALGPKPDWCAVAGRAGAGR